MKDFDLTELFKLGSKSQVNIANFNKGTEPYLRGVALAKPIRLTDSSGNTQDLFDDSNFHDFKLQNGLVDGQLSDPISGKTIKFTDPESFAEAQKLLEDIREQELQKKIHNEIIARQMIFISSAGTPDQTEAYYKSSIASLKNLAKFISGVTGVKFQSFSNNDYSEIQSSLHHERLLESINLQIDSLNKSQKDDVLEAIKSNLSFMSLSELMQFASKIPGINSIIKARLELVKKAGLDPLSAQFKSGTELKKIISNKKRKSIISNLTERSDVLDFGKVILGKTDGSRKKLRDKLDWYPTIEIA